METKKKKKKGNAVLIVFIIFFLCIAIVAGFICVRKLLNDGKSKTQYREVRQEVVEEAEEGAPIKIDWGALKAINEDVIGWIYIGCLDVSYPIMKTDDNAYYLHRTIYRDYLYAGSIFLDMNNSTDFRDPNSIIYGHNMIDGSMFGTLYHIPYQNAAKDDPFFWILTPQGDYKYAMFSAFGTVPETKAYSFFPVRDDSFISWALEMQNQSVVSFPAQSFSKNDNVVTLSTCGATSAERTIVMGVCVNGPIVEVEGADKEPLVEMVTEPSDE